MLGLTAVAVFGWLTIRQGFGVCEIPTSLEAYIAKAALRLSVPASERNAKNPFAPTTGRADGWLASALRQESHESSILAKLKRPGGHMALLRNQTKTEGKAAVTAVVCGMQLSCNRDGHE